MTRGPVNVNGVPVHTKAHDFHVVENLKGHGGYDVVMSIDGTYADRGDAEATLVLWREWILNGAAVDAMLGALERDRQHAP